MAGDKDIQHLTEAVKENTRAFKDLKRVAEALNTNLVALIRQHEEGNESGRLSGS